MVSCEPKGAIGCDEAVRCGGGVGGFALLSGALSCGCCLASVFSSASNAESWGFCGDGGCGFSAGFGGRGLGGSGLGSGGFGSGGFGCGWGGGGGGGGGAGGAGGGGGGGGGGFGGSGLGGSGLGGGGGLGLRDLFGLPWAGAASRSSGSRGSRARD